MDKRKVTRTEEEIKNIKKFILSHGFKNMREFGDAVGMERQNISARITGKCDPNIRMLLKWATVLQCDIIELIKLFYSKEYNMYYSRKK